MVKLIAQEANKITKLMFTKTGRWLFYKSMVSIVTVRKNC